MTCAVSPVFQRYVPLPTAVKLTAGLVQVNVALAGLMLTVGGVWSAPTTTLVEAVQPLAPVTVTEYVLADVTLMV